MIEPLQEFAYLISYIWNTGGIFAKFGLIFDLIGVVYFTTWVCMYAYYKIYKHEEVPAIVINV